MEKIALDQQLCFSLYGASMAISRAYKPLLDKLGITYPQYLVLSSLWEQDGLGMGAIANRLLLEPSTITPLVKRLENSGLAKRVRNQKDERQVEVFLTPKGRALAADCICLTETLQQSSGMQVADIAALNTQVATFRDSVSEYVAAHPADLLTRNVNAF